jgi:transposase InsO family protein
MLKSYAYKRMCKALKVFESGYFRWKNKTKTARQIQDEILVPIIRKIHEESRQTYGTTRIKAALEKLGILCGTCRIRRLMRANGIYSITRYKHKPYPKQKVETRYNENILAREFNVNEPDRVWCGDITYIKTVAGWVGIVRFLLSQNDQVIFV